MKSCTLLKSEITQHLSFPHHPRMILSKTKPYCLATTPRNCIQTPSRLRTPSSPTHLKELTPSKVILSKVIPSQSSRQQLQTHLEGILSKKVTHSTAQAVMTSSRNRQRMTHLPQTPSQRTLPYLQSSTHLSPVILFHPPASPRKVQIPLEP